MRLGRRRGVSLLLGAGVLAAAVARGPLEFHWVPLVSGLTFLLAAFAGTRRGPLWAPGIVISCWGLGVVARGEGFVDRPEGAVFLVAVGAGAVLAAVAERFGFAVDLLGTALAILAVGVLSLLRPDFPEVLGSAWTYAGILGAWGVWELRPGR